MLSTTQQPKLKGHHSCPHHGRAMPRNLKRCWLCESPWSEEIQRLSFLIRIGLGDMQQSKITPAKIKAAVTRTGRAIDAALMGRFCGVKFGANQDIPRLCKR